MRVQLICNFNNLVREVVREQFRKRGQRVHSWKVHLLRSSKTVVSDLVQFFGTIIRLNVAIVIQFIGF